MSEWNEVVLNFQIREQELRDIMKEQAFKINRLERDYETALSETQKLVREVIYHEDREHQIRQVLGNTNCNLVDAINEILREEKE